MRAKRDRVADPHSIVKVRIREADAVEVAVNPSVIWMRRTHVGLSKILLRSRAAVQIRELFYTNRVSDLFPAIEANSCCRVYATRLMLAGWLLRSAAAGAVCSL